MGSFKPELLKVTPASFRDAKDLEAALGAALAKSQIDLSGLDVNEKDIMNTDLTNDMLGQILKSALTVLCDRKIEDALFKCANNRVLYNKEKINEDFFDEVANREMYYPIMFEIAKENVGPFVGSLFSQFGGLTKAIESIRK